MSEDTKDTAPAEGDPKPKTESPASETAPTTPAAKGEQDKPAPPKAPAAHKPAPPPKKGPTITVEISGDPFIDKVKERFGDAITEAVATLGQQVLQVKLASYV